MQGVLSEMRNLVAVILILSHSTRDTCCDNGDSFARNVSSCGDVLGRKISDVANLLILN
jgi:hypothetical protein